MICNSVKKKKERNRKDYGCVLVLRDLSPNKYGTFWRQSTGQYQKYGPSVTSMFNVTAVGKTESEGPLRIKNSPLYSREKQVRCKKSTLCPADLAQWLNVAL